MCAFGTDLQSYIQEVRAALRLRPKVSDTDSLLAQGPSMVGTTYSRHSSPLTPSPGRVTANLVQLPHPHRLVWVSTSCQIGLAFGPMHVYEGSHGWGEHSVFFEHDGKSLEVFFEDKQDVFYAGTYKFEHIRHRNPQGCVRSTPEVRILPSFSHAQLTEDQS